MTEEFKIKLAKSAARNRRIASGEIPPLEAIEQLVADGMSREWAGRKVAALTGEFRHEIASSKKAPFGQPL